MLRLSRILPALALSALLALAASPAAGAGDTPAPAAASKKKGKAAKCKKGYVRKTVTKKGGKKVKRCVKKKQSAGGGPGGSTSLFPAPGRTLEGEEAKTWVARYLPNSTFTDCPAGWPSCAVEQRYGFSSSGAFHYCRLTSSSGSDIRSSGEYRIENAKVEADGSWIAQLLTYAYENLSVYEWKVSAQGVVNGAYQFQPGSSVEQIGPLQYLGGVAKDCSY